jgi:hypothetical protein
MDEEEPGRLAVWRLRNGNDTVRLHVDLDFDWTVTLTIGPDGHTITTFSDSFAEWLAASTQEARP